MEYLQAHPWLLAMLIFLARVTDVSMGTLRTIIVFRGYKLIAAAIGFFEVLLWLVAVGQVLKHLDAWYLAVAYAAGFATGNVIGMWLEGKLAIGIELVRAISEDPGIRLAEQLRSHGYPVTELPGTGAGASPVEVLLVVESRKRVPGMLRVIHESDPQAVCTLSDVRRPRAPGPVRARLGPLSALLRFVRHRK